MRPLKKSVSITIDSDLLEKVKVIAELDDRSFFSGCEFSAEGICQKERY